jgi:hypothetical protein
VVLSWWGEFSLAEACWGESLGSYTPLQLGSASAVSAHVFVLRCSLTSLLLLCAAVQVVRVLNSVTWQPLLECHHGSPVEEPAEVAVYQEVEEPRGVLAPMQVRCVWLYTASLSLWGLGLADAVTNAALYQEVEELRRVLAPMPVRAATPQYALCNVGSGQYSGVQAVAAWAKTLFAAIVLWLCITRALFQCEYVGHPTHALSQ